jgi:hypothetical protein
MDSAFCGSMAVWWDDVKNFFDRHLMHGYAPTVQLLLAALAVLAAGACLATTRTLAIPVTSAARTIRLPRVGGEKRTALQPQIVIFISGGLPDGGSDCGGRGRGGVGPRWTSAVGGQRRGRAGRSAR